MEFAKVNVEVRTAAKKGARARFAAQGHGPGVLYGRKREPLAVTFNEKELLTLAGQGEAPQHRAHADRRATAGKSRRGDGDGARRADQPAQPRAWCTSTSCAST